MIKNFLLIILIFLSYYLNAQFEYDQYVYEKEIYGFPKINYQIASNYMFIFDNEYYNVNEKNTNGFGLDFYALVDPPKDGTDRSKFGIKTGFYWIYDKHYGKTSNFIELIPLNAMFNYDIIKDKLSLFVDVGVLFVFTDGNIGVNYETGLSYRINRIFFSLSYQYFYYQNTYINMEVAAIDQKLFKLTVGMNFKKE
jgi:hypothetical protein